MSERELWLLLSFVCAFGVLALTPRAKECRYARPPHPDRNDMEEDDGAKAEPGVK